MNKVFIVGRLTKAPDHKTTQSGISVATFTVAVTRRMNREETDFLNVVAWRGLADNCGKYLVKGQQVAVCGEIRTRSYEDKDGVRRYVTEIQADDVEFLAKPGQGAPGGESSAPARSNAAANSFPSKQEEEELESVEAGMGDVLMEDEELPF